MNNILRASLRMLARLRKYGNEDEIKPRCVRRAYVRPGIGTWAECKGNLWHARSWLGEHSSDDR
eukprot:1160349-Pelagomonas_calceolata.AAC.1